jgi:asparagine synthetase B (glutamine-hydrolysing)
MCGVIGIVSKNIIPKDIIHNLIVQSKIRGQHASGISYLENDIIKTKIIPKNATFMDLEDVNTKCLIGHTRYSTSSLEYNQPINYLNVSIVHNGVITQEHSDNWGKYNYKFKTSNDSEFILKSYIEGNQPIEEYKDASISSIILDNNSNKVHFFRNEKRPLYYAETKDTYYIASTKNILVRSGYENITKCSCCVNYTIKNNKLTKYKIRDVNVDLQ